MPRTNATKSTHTLPSTLTGVAPTQYTIPTTRPQTSPLQAAAKRLDKTLQKAAPNANHRLHLAIDKNLPQVHRALHSAVDAVFKSDQTYRPHSYGITAAAAPMPPFRPSVKPPPPPPPPSQTPPRPTRPPRPSVKIPSATEAERAVLRLTNAVRARSRLRSVSLSSRLGRAAGKQAEYLAGWDGRLTHVGRDGSSVGDRVRRAGYAHAHAVENVSKGRGGKEVLDGWLGSPEGRLKIMDRRVRDMGVAVRQGKDGSLYWVQVLGVRR